MVFDPKDVRRNYVEMTERGVPFENEMKVVMSEEGHDLLGASFRDPGVHYGTLSGWVTSG